MAKIIRNKIKSKLVTFRILNGSITRSWHAVVNFQFVAMNVCRWFYLLFCSILSSKIAKYTVGNVIIMSESVILNKSQVKVVSYVRMLFTFLLILKVHLFPNFGIFLFYVAWIVKITQPSKISKSVTLKTYTFLKYKFL